MFYTVYKITNIINNKIYIGVHKTNNLNDDYMGSGTHLKRAVAKYGIDSFKKEYIQIFDNAEDMFNMEAQLVNEDFVKDPETYNLKLGGEGGFYINNGDSKHIARTKKGRKNANVALEEKYGQDWNKVIGSMAHKHRTKESYIDSGQKAAQTLIAKTGHGSFYGKNHTDESKVKIGNANSKYQTGSGNSQHGTCWVHSINEKLNKKIKKEQLDEFINNGWIQGRKMKF